jgi:cation diffusion facilitator CzcD-associated flavoprotein CzcO
MQYSKSHYAYRSTDCADSIGRMNVSTVRQVPRSVYPGHQRAEPMPTSSSSARASAGMYAHYRFRQLGLSVFGFEQGTDVGGTWYWNRYPGARCDVESVDYTYTFSRELLEEWQWSERFSTQPEILDYARYVADKFDLRRDIRFETKIVSARYDEAANLWTVTTDKGDAITCHWLVTTVGCLSVPKDPDFEGTGHASRASGCRPAHGQRTGSTGPARTCS